MPPRPFFTVITATYNAEKELPGLLDSLFAQSCRDFELIIQDGASTDNTVKVAQSYQARLPGRNRTCDADRDGNPPVPSVPPVSSVPSIRPVQEVQDVRLNPSASEAEKSDGQPGGFPCPSLPRLVINSEPDTGVYDAWNKALPRVTGEWVIFLGADDRLAGADFLAQCRQALEQAAPETDFGIAALQKLDAQGRAFKRLEPDGASVYANLHRGMMLPHTALLHRRRVFAGKLFDTGFKIAGDYDFICRVCRPETRFADIPQALIQMGGGGLSNNPRHIWRLRKEVSLVLRRYAPGRIFTPWYLLFMLKGLVMCGLGALPGGAGIVDGIKRLLGR